MKVKIAGSGRHIHITKENLEILFGEGFELEPQRYLSQPGEYASTSKLEVIGPSGSFPGLTVIGPCRAFTQVELSKSDARVLGIDAPIRESGHLEGSGAVTLRGPKGEIALTEGAIIAKRHVHFKPEDAEALGIANKDIIKVRIGGERALIFDEVVARVSPKYNTHLHLDFDELNAAAAFGKEGEIVK